MNDWTPLTECVACGSTRLKQFLELGAQPLANNFHDSTKELPRYPLGLNLCLTCGHSQQLGVVRKELIFDEYPYVSGTSQTLRDYFDHFVSKVETDMPSRRLTVLEIASNDGTLLQKFAARGHFCRGVEPAKNIYSPATTYQGYWDEKALAAVAAEFDVIIAMNVLGHVADPAEFLRLCKKVLAPKGRIYIQVSQARMVRYGQADTCYHEHISFFNEASFIALARRIGLNIEQLQLTEIHGGSMLVEFTSGECACQPDVEKLERCIALEEDYDGFQAKVEAVKKRLREKCNEWMEKNYVIVGVGAAAKAMTILNFGQIKLDYIIDENPLKIGKYSPGMNIPVVSFDVLKREPENCLFIFTAWNFTDELERKLIAFRGSGRGDVGYCYFPEPRQWMIS